MSGPASLRGVWGARPAPKRTFAWRSAGGAALGVACVAACVAGLPEGGARDAEALANKKDVAKVADAGAGAAQDASNGEGGPGCIYGELEDPHRGFVRCLAPNEVDAGWLPPAPQPEPAADAGAADGGADAGPGLDAGPPAPVPLVELGTPSFESGEVPNVEKALQKAAADIGRCVANHGGLSGASGSMKVQFLVRGRGRAEGVEVLRASGTSQDAAECVRALIKNKAVGAPTADPVGVTITFSFKAGRK